MFTPLNAFGPAVVISIIVLITVVITKIFSRVYKTKRYLKLQKEFQHWFNIRQEALKSEESEKGKTLAKNIDTSKLNKIYYDYFFEGLLNSLLTKYVPIFIMLAYVNETYKPDNLLKHFGRGYIFKFTRSDGRLITVGAVFWFVISMLLVYVAWFFIQKLYVKYAKIKPPA